MTDNVIPIKPKITEVAGFADQLRSLADALERDATTKVAIVVFVQPPGATSAAVLPLGIAGGSRAQRAMIELFERLGGFA